MFQLLIAEDEVLVGIGLKNSVKWENLDIEIAGEAQDGKTAWQMYQQLHPDIVMTDIRMPGMDGIELIEKIREKDDRTKIVILTCLEEFDLVRKALSLGVSDYLLKTNLKSSNIETVMQKLTAGLRKEERKEEHHNPLMLMKNYTELEAFEALEQNSPGIMVLSILTFFFSLSSENVFDEKHDKTVQETIYRLVFQAVEPPVKAIFYRIGERKYVLICTMEKQEENLREKLEALYQRIIRLIKSYLNIEFLIAEGGSTERTQELSELEQKAEKLTESGFFCNRDTTLLREEDSFENTYQDNLEQFHTKIARITWLDKRYRQELENQILQLRTMYRAKPNEIKEIFVQLGYLFYAYHRKNEKSSMYAIEYATKLRSFCTFSGLCDYFLEFLQMCKMQQDCMSHLSKEVAEAMEYIQQHYAENITLQMIADKVGMNAYYFSSLYKKETKIGLIKYLNSVRVDKAKELLDTTNLKLYEISEKVGFVDDSYFSRVFKEFTGIRPTEYRKKNVHLSWLSGKEDVK